MQINELSGFLLIDKPAGLSSFDVIRHLRKQTGIKTFGHAGTLDPFATGLLLIAVNKYTRLLSLLEFADKEYIAAIILGHESTTGDTEGEITAVNDKTVDSGALSKLKQEVLRIDKLKPPIYSAVKVNGKRAYDRARADEDFELPERESCIHEFDIVTYEHPKLVYSCKVSKGTYIRSLSLRIAEFLGTKAYTSELRRTSIDKISLDRASQLTEITQDTLTQHLVSVLDILPELESITLMEEQLNCIRNGNHISNEGEDNRSILVFDSTQRCMGIAYRKDNMLHPKVNL